TYRRALSLALTTESSADTIFRNGARPSGVVRTDNKMSSDQLGEFEERFDRKWVGAHNAGRPMILHSGLHWEKLTIDPVDAQMLESRRLGMEIVCQIFECDPHLVGITSGNTKLGSSISDQTLSLVKFKMHKRLK
ncbi:phage portal protein, partial [Escherichia coli]|nr:phage portal protein [Escherichia coli]